MNHEPEVEGIVVAREHARDVEIDASEPSTPTWMPLLGAGLFLFAAIAFVATRPAGKTTDELRRDAEKALEASKPAAVLEAPPPPPPAPAAAQRMPQGGCGT